MKFNPKNGVILLAATAVVSLAAGCTSPKNTATEAARAVIERTIERPARNLDLRLVASEDSLDRYAIHATDGKLRIEGSSVTALCYAFNRYLKEACHSMVTWSGKNLNIPDRWTDFEAEGSSPYRLRYFLNVCTFGYTTPYWDWERWERELDWMALHGVNLPLATVASEAIARRVWLKLGLTEEEIASFFTGAAHLPWHRMGNLNGFDGPLPESWHEAQLELQHRILDRMHELGMEPVAPAFAGFVPPAFLARHPDISYNQLEWGGFPPEYNACVLAPDSPWFEKLGALFIQEWEAEFGKARYFLSDSFNEMKLPVDPADTAAKHRLLADYGEAIHRSIKAGDPDAVWVTQGWTFGYQHDFWDRESLQALLSRVPDRDLIIIDLGNDYPKWVWHTEQTWKVHDGFYGKQWIYSYVPNFGGKVLPTGDLAMYASGSVEALESSAARTLVGFGSAPEGLENNEVVYELLGDMGWSRQAIDLDRWTENYCTARYGGCDTTMRAAWQLLRRSVYASLYSYPRFTWQTVDPDPRRPNGHALNDDFGQAVKLFLDGADRYATSPLYRNDALEFAALWLGEVADRHYTEARTARDAGNRTKASAELNRCVELLKEADRLLASHPDYRLDEWVGYAEKAAPTDSLRQHYASNARRLISTWGGFQEDYAARFWSGMIRDYYIPRLEIRFSDHPEQLDAWEEAWIQSPRHTETQPYDDPIEAARRLIASLE
ncbi:alpha-N-acetylglucosaminidase [Alistipes sp.]|uniref:alpha-N-acetylglucosaminidase n=1 Tax=Alistipes sp. TaxID=1872444 RepID=UPI003A887424